MSLLRSLIRKFWNGEDDEEDVDASHGILIKPDGTWEVAKSPKPKKATINPPNIIRPSSFIPGKDFSYYDQPSSSQAVLSFPPAFFPHANELNEKLEKCVELDIISSCVHKQTNNNVYILSIELPCGNNVTEAMNKFTAFVKAMKDVYDLNPIQQERINSVVSQQNYYLVVFEYDPKKYVFDKPKKDE
jgi:hypothetical protein